MLSPKGTHKEMAKPGLPLKPHLKAQVQLLPAASYLPAARENYSHQQRHGNGHRPGTDRPHLSPGHYYGTRVAGNLK